MLEIRIDGKDLQTRQQAHEFLADQDGFPDGYGKNLDAMYDVLTSLPEVKVTVCDPDSIVINLGEYGKKLLLVIKYACDKNPGIVLEIEEGKEDKIEGEEAIVVEQKDQCAE